MIYYRLPLYILFGVLPSLIWLFYYLKKDMHPEPKKMIVKIFFYGILVTIPVFLLQVGLSAILDQIKILGFFNGYPIIEDLLKWFVVIALTEETLKYGVVKLAILKSDELDEPLDIMLYMVVVALGFAALENILYLFSPIDNMSFNAIIGSTIVISFIRFIGATFLHTLCSGLIGYFLAKSILENRSKLHLTMVGILFSTLLHGLYNFSIITMQAPFNFFIPLIIILGLIIFMVYDFDNIKKVKGICKIN